MGHIKKKSRFYGAKTHILSVSLLAILSMANPAFAQDTASENAQENAQNENSRNESPQSENNGDDMIVVIGRGSRLPVDVTSVPGTVSVISSEDLSTQSGMTTDLGKMLEQQITSLGPSARDGNNFSQTLRGRKPAFFVDGFSQSLSLRGGGRDMRIINSSVIERIEVIHGATSIYGSGGSGGIVNYITKQPKPGLSMVASAEFGMALTDITSDSFDDRFTATLTYGSDKWDAVVNGTYQSRGLDFDANGNAVPPDPYGQTGLADSETINFYGKIGYNFSPDVRFEVSALHYDMDVDTNYTIAQGDFANDIVSVAELKRQNNFSLLGGFLRFDFIGDVDPSNFNTFLRSSLQVNNILGGNALELQAFYQDTQLVWRHLDFIAISPLLGGLPPNGSQLQTDASKRGARLDITTPLDLGGMRGTLLWGGEYTVDRTGKSLVDGREYTSVLEQESISAFAQLQIDLTDNLHLRAGIRYDDFDLNIPDFQSPDRFNGTRTHNVIGADLNYDSFTGNAGLVFDITDDLNIFGSWSNGFSIGDVLRSIRGVAPRTPGPSQTINVQNLGLLIEAQKVDSFEAGARFGNNWLNASITGFYSKSDLGSTFDPVTFATLRAPERIWGLELSVDADVTSTLNIGAGFTTMDSKTDTNNDGIYDGPLDFTRVPPNRAVAHISWDFVENWNVRLQSSTIFNDSRFDAPFGSFQRDVDGYTMFDMLIGGNLTDQLSVSLGIENLFNKDYIPMATLLACSDDPITQSFCNVRSTGTRATFRMSLAY